MNSPIWILDDGPIGVLAANIDISSVGSWPTGHFAVANQTYLDAQPGDTCSRRDLILAESTSGERIFRKFEIQMGSTAAEILYNHFNANPRNTLDLAELETMSWILAEDADAILVTFDKRAALTALAELGRLRVAHGNELWSHLFGVGLITKEQLKTLFVKSKAKDQGLPQQFPWQHRSLQVDI